MKKIFVTGTDTGVGKTLVCAGLCASSKACFYWKPIQTGIAHEMDDAKTISQYVLKKRILASAFQFKAPLSPNQAALKEGKKEVFIHELISKMKNPIGSLVIEGIGGIKVPLNDKESVLDLIGQLKAKTLIVARSGLGTLNHTFLTLQALRAKKISILGVILVGPLNPENKRDIECIGKTKILLELPILPKPILKKDLLKPFRVLKDMF